MANIIATPGIVTINPIPTLDGKGEIVWYDDFETGPPYPIVATTITDPLGSKWDWAGSIDAGSRIALSSAWSKSGMFSLKLQTGNTATNFLAISRTSSLIQSRRLGFEFSFEITTPGNMNVLGLSVKISAGGSLYEADVIVNAINSQVLIMNSNGDRQVIALLDNAGYGSLKFVIDQIEWRYVKAILGSRILPLNEGMWVTPGYPTWEGFMKLGIFCETEVDASAIAYIDDVIITRREV